ncbi:MAG: helix-turn-helix domain-containing protein [Bacilli bacterium]|nr:helix-turn-helix domain-containing protein [Bacilli bacterium]
MENQKSFYIVMESDIITSDISDKAKIIYAIVSSYSNNEFGYCYLTYKQIAELLKISVRQFYRCLSELKEKNYLNIIYKNNRAYLIPTINKFIELRKSEPAKFKEIFNYNWLDEQSKN